MKVSLMAAALRRLPDDTRVNKIVSAGVNSYLRITDKIKLTIARRSKHYGASYEENPSVMVYIPTFNRINYLLARSIPSVLAQTYRNIHILVVDDGSTDFTKEILCEHYGSRVTVLKNDRSNFRYPNKSLFHWFAGPVDAANLALLNCKSCWIARIDDDDEWLPDHIERAVKELLRSKAEFLSADYLVLDKGGNAEKRISADPLNGIGGTQTWVYHAALKNMRYNIHCWRKNHNRVNDTDLQSRFYKAGVKIVHSQYVACIIKPREDEDCIGSLAYINSADKYEKFYSPSLE